MAKPSRLGLCSSFVVVATLAAAPAFARGQPELIELMGHKWGKGHPTEALQQRFPAGSSEAALIDALKASDFHLGKPKADGSRYARNYWGGGLACTDIYTVTWRADAGRVAEIKGDVEGSC
jgi:hypothetical protein